MKRTLRVTAGMLILGIALAACTTDTHSDAETTDSPTTQETDAATDAVTDDGAGGGTPEGEFFVRADYERQLAQRDVTPEGDPATPWLQMIEPGEMVDTAEFTSEIGRASCRGSR